MKKLLIKQRDKENMKIVTCNVPSIFVDIIKLLVGNTEDKLYPSRSELIRVAVRDFIKKNIKKIEQAKLESPLVEEDEDVEAIRIPVESKDAIEPVREFKDYKIIKRLY